MRLVSSVVAFGIGVVSLAACASGSGALRSPSNASDLSFAGASSFPEDGPLEAAIRAIYERDDAVRGERFDVTARHGVVTLKGLVRTLSAKESAVADAKSVTGVRAVIDRLDLDRPVVDDVELDSRIVRALAQNGVTAPYSFLVDARDGVVQVAGDVGSWQALRVARAVVAGTAGVVDVRASIAVYPERDRTEETVRAEVEDRLRRDLRIDPRGVRVFVHDGVVELSGSVSNVRDRARIEEDVAGPSIRSVVDDLRLVGGAAEMQSPVDTLPPAPIYDADMRAAVLDAFAQDPRMGAAHPDVGVRFGRAVLEGVVPNASVRDAAKADAENAVGVTDVRDSMTLAR